MTSGTCKVLVLSDIDAVDKLRNVVGAPDPVAAQEKGVQVESDNRGLKLIRTMKIVEIRLN